MILTFRFIMFEWNLNSNTATPTPTGITTGLRMTLTCRTGVLMLRDQSANDAYVGSPWLFYMATLDTKSTSSAFYSPQTNICTRELLPLYLCEFWIWLLIQVTTPTTELEQIYKKTQAFFITRMHMALQELNHWRNKCNVRQNTLSSEQFSCTVQKDQKMSLC